MMIIHYTLLVIQLLIVFLTYKCLFDTDGAWLRRKIREKDTKIDKLVARNKRITEQNDKLLKKLANTVSVVYKVNYK